jgi:thiamine-monophosphate kinase
VVAVSGELGLAAAGLRLLFEQAVDAAGAPDPRRAAELAAREPERIGAQLRPRPPVADGVLAADAGATAMLDLSDGLALDARRIATASGVAIDLARDAVRTGEALTGGEDHALLATFPPDVSLPAGFRRIGSVVDGTGVLVDGQPYDDRGGWDPFAGWNGAAG